MNIYKKRQTDQNEIFNSIGFDNLLGSIKQTTLAGLSMEYLNLQPYHIQSGEWIGT